MPISEEKALANAIIVLLEALPYISANSVPVLHHADEDNSRDLPALKVDTSMRERLAPNADFYRIIAEIDIFRNRNEDPDQSISDVIINEVSDWANNLTAGDLGVDGIVNVQGSQDLQDSIHMRGVSFDIYTTIA